MPSLLISIVRTIAHSMGIEISKYPCPDLDPFALTIIKKVQPYTMTSAERIYSACESVRYIIKNDIPGDIVECGVWKGGSMMAMAMTLLEQKNKSRDLWLYDTFEGMSEPTDKDVSVYGIEAKKIMTRKKRQGSVWCYSRLDEVKQAVYGTGYPKEKIKFIKGKVEDTIPKQIPNKISILRLDTDWYESTYHELVNLFPLLSTGGVLIIDDYGYWHGSRQATDEYIRDNQIKILLNRIDDSGRIAIKQ